MFIIPLMVFIGWQTGNNLWLYLALGLASTGAVLKAGKEQAQKQVAAKQLSSSLDDLLKGLRATQN